LIDVQYYIAKLGSLDGIDGPGNSLEVVVNQLKIKSATARNLSMDAMRASLDGNGRGSVDSNVSSSTSSSSPRKFSLWQRSGISKE
jgi:vacuolar protein sorting-associated protein 54